MHDLDTNYSRCVPAVKLCISLAPGTTLEQEDTFFKAPNGRLKVSIHRSIDDYLMQSYLINTSDY